MRKPVKPGKLGIALAALLSLVGCNANRNNTKLPDPLFGAAPGPSAARPTGNASAVPVPNGSTTNAALVNGSMPPPGYNPVGTQPNYNPVGTPAGWQPGVAPPQAGQPYPPYPPNSSYPAQPGYPPTQPGYPPPAAQPYPPSQPYATPIQPAYPPGQPSYPPPAPASTNLTSLTPGYSSPAGPRLASYDQAQSYLASLGVKWQRLESGPDGEWKFACSIPRRENPAIARTYEGRAPTYLAAVQSVLDQIQHDRP